MTFPGTALRCGRTAPRSPPACAPSTVGTDELALLSEGPEEETCADHQLNDDEHPVERRCVCAWCDQPVRGLSCYDGEEQAEPAVLASCVWVLAWAGWAWLMD